MSGGRKRSSSSSSEESEQNGRELPPTRRDDNSISFRHFLQQQSDVVPTGNSRRTPRPNAALVDLVDVHGGLPDFVQDHLVVEAQVVGDDAHPMPNPVSPLDLALINQMMPNLMNSSSQRHANNACGAELPVEELGAFGPAPGGPSLPDFLSDGPMHCDATTGNSGGADAQSRSTRFLPARCSTGSLGRSQLRTSSQNTDSLLQQIQKLEQDVQDRDRRIQELENLIFEQKAELVGLYEQLAENQQNEAQSKPGSVGMHHLHQQGNDVRQSHHEPLTNGTVSIPNSRHLEGIATRAESLLGELLNEIRQLRKAANANTD